MYTKLRCEPKQVQEDKGLCIVLGKMNNGLTQ